ncbi:MAG: hypothetical protein AAGD07_05890 [Planctomycetota bacterium]
MDRSSSSPPSNLRHRHGQALVEFAIISFVLTGMLMGFLLLITIGLGSFQNNIAGESAGRVLDENTYLTRRHFNEHFAGDASYDPDADLNAERVYQFLTEFEFDLEDENGDPVLDSGGMAIPTTLYDESKLVLSTEDYFAERNTPTLPAINRLLLGQFVFDPDLVVDSDGEPGGYRYPGAVVRNADGEQTVLIPLLDFEETVNGTDTTFDGIERNNQGVTVNNAFPVNENWVAPVTIVTNGDGTFKSVIFLPSQPGASVQWRLTRDDEGRVVSQSPVSADDSLVAAQLDTLPTGYALAAPTPVANATTTVNRGDYGLGEVFISLNDDSVDADPRIVGANTYLVRPYRRVFESASVFRVRPDVFTAKYEREPVTPPSTTPTITIYNESDDVNIAPETETVVSPFEAYEFNNDQALVLDEEVIDGYGQDDSLLMQLAPPSTPNPPSSSNDFHQNVVIVPPFLGEDRWTVNTRLELVLVDPADPSGPSPDWQERDVATDEEGDAIELRLYKNGVFQAVIASKVIIDLPSPPNGPIDVVGTAEILAEGGDYLQVRVFLDPQTEEPTGSSPNLRAYNANLTDETSRNWVEFHHGSASDP